ncbi:MAG: hypothetical protein HC772_00460 [Leptolyngbyaceae cyanobacterium CRU_2_3]|nr:hypothetical protein [Leptolyngbyaceae cyanobacterium CRU_2_3]
MVSSHHLESLESLAQSAQSFELQRSDDPTLPLQHSNDLDAIDCQTDDPLKPLQEYTSLFMVTFISRPVRILT